MLKLSIIIPCYNEQNTIKQLIDKVILSDIGNILKEIIVINDGSSDKTRNILSNIKKIKLLNNSSNIGKGYSVKRGIKESTGDYIIIQDGDLEYDPSDYKKLLDLFQNQNIHIVYGSRRLKKNKFSHLSFYLGGIFLTYLVNILFPFSKNITDGHTCYKMFRANILKDLNIKSNGFELCPELTVKFLKLGYSIYEVPISYNPRTNKDGKKIKWIDGLIAIYTILRFRIFNDK
ncbi:MAG: glycosyl transferase [Pelagibacteraceae bacterium]|mgnify:CR=1 FL=1|nr:glycosyl transferase [Pelagibacteraceae bacterium]